jgi:hypothetical protein
VRELFEAGAVLAALSSPLGICGAVMRTWLRVQDAAQWCNPSSETVTFRCVRIAEQRQDADRHWDSWAGRYPNSRGHFSRCPAHRIGLLPPIRA